MTPAATDPASLQSIPMGASSLDFGQALDECAGWDDLPDHRVECRWGGDHAAPRRGGELDLGTRVGGQERLASVEQPEGLLVERLLPGDRHRPRRTQVAVR